MDDFITLRQVAAELGLDRVQTRERLRQRNIRPHKVHANGPDGPVVLALTRTEVQRFREGDLTGPGIDSGAYYVIQLVPDLDARRVKLGFSPDPAGHVTILRAGAPTARLLRAWPCRPAWAPAAHDCLAGDCRPITDGVFDCDELDQCVARGETFFTLLPHR